MLVRLGKAVDIWSTGKYPADVLSNLAGNSFCFDGVPCGSMEGFLQSLKYKDKDEQRRICSLSGREAKGMSMADWQTSQIVWWQGVAVGRQTDEFHILVNRAYKALFEQNMRFRDALTASSGKRLYHSHGVQDPHKTILTEKEFIQILTKLREETYES